MVEETIDITVDLSINKKHDTNFQGLTYVLGFIARKFRRDHPDLGKPTLLMTKRETDDSLCTWILRISKGGLVAPSDEFLKDGQAFEEEFNKFHACKQKYDGKPWVIKRFTEVLAKRFGSKYSWKVYEMFAKTRTNIRIKDLNKQLRDKQGRQTGIREHKQLGQLTVVTL